MDLLKEIKGQSPKSKIALIIRHADRDQIPSGQFGNDILLNKQGEKNAFVFGKSFQEYKINKILTSPIQRCVQTAEFILRGYGKGDVEIIPSTCLGNPGLHIINDQVAGEYFLKYGFYKILEEFIEGNTSPGLRKRVEYQEMMTEFIDRNTQEQGLTLFITHDSLIALYHYCISQKIYTHENWVPYLGGLTINAS